jgi:tRNA modification GTPase
VSTQDTIVAIATAAGRGGIGIVRISGAQAATITCGIAGELPEPRSAALRTFRDAEGNAIDSGVIIYFRAPNSFTGEDVIELHGHGSPVALDMLVARALELGARLAEPGEFSRRAFLNDKIDLVEAEAIADLIDSASAQAARAAVRSLQGEFSQRVHALVEALIATRMYVEAAIDFPEEEIDFLADESLRVRFDELLLRLNEITQSARQGTLLRDGMTVVIAGKPNAGKSSLLNALAGYDAAIVTPIAGTTRDVLKERIHIDGMPLHIIDTAGLRESEDIVEMEGVRRARAAMTSADRILYLIDSTEPPTHEQLRLELAMLPANVPITLVLNKIDLLQQSPKLEVTDPPRICISVTAGAGLQLLRSHLKECVGYHSEETGTLSARRRHLDALARAMTHVRAAERLLIEHHAGELVAEELRQAQHHLGEITGEFTSDELLGRIFSTFCIGK